MKILTPGHLYELENFEKPEDPGLLLQFIEKVNYGEAYKLGHARPLAEGEDAKTVLITVNNGTTNEEVLKVLIDRLKFLSAKFPCRETAIVITKLEESLMWLEKRTADRKARSVEGKHLA